MAQRVVSFKVTADISGCVGANILKLDVVFLGKYPHDRGMQSRGDYIGGRFVGPEGQSLVSNNPSDAGSPVLTTFWSADRMDAACAAAEEVFQAWMRLSRSERADYLMRFRHAIQGDAEKLAEAIMLETGKLLSEAKMEVQALLSRFDLVIQQINKDLPNGPVPGFPREILRHRPLGVIGVIGPFNFPLHLCHAHVVPALFAGNTVVIKPSEVTPLCGQRYAEAAEKAQFPPGVFNLVQGKAAAGARLVAHPAVRGICFTGSYSVGQKIRQVELQRPELLVALEMGGKNIAVVLDDADLRQAAHEVVVGGYLTTGQRCTGTDRVLVQRQLAEPFARALCDLVKQLSFGDPRQSHHFAGPLATREGAQRCVEAIALARASGVEPLVEGRIRPDGYFVDASLHRSPQGVHDIPGYTDVEVFGPDLLLEVVEDEYEAIDVIRRSPYGLANSIFTASDERFERFYQQTMVGILNRNRSTNLASPRLPFGGIGRSGNYRPAGAHAGRNVVLPMAIQNNVLGEFRPHPLLVHRLPRPDLDQLEKRHRMELLEEAKRNLLDTPRPMSVQTAPNGMAPVSESWLTRLYAGGRVVREKKPIVFDHLRSAGPYFVSVDDPPMAVLDGMSQTSTLCGGFAEHAVVRAYVEGGFGNSSLQNNDTTHVDTPEVQAFADVLRHLVPGLPHVTFANSGAEANEKAFALCQKYARAELGNKVLAFEGSFHGRTLVALHATHNPAKRVPYQLAGYEATFAPFPVWPNPTENEPAAPAGFYAAIGAGELEDVCLRFGEEQTDLVLAAEVRSLLVVHELLKTTEYFACIVEPMQSEGGDRYATARFFRALRLLTRFHQVALIMDEVQTGFGLGGSFVWHSQFCLVNVRGQPDWPDAVSFSKRAQLGIVMSRFIDPEPTSVHSASLIRGRIHAEMMSTNHGAERCEKLVGAELRKLASAFSHLVIRPRFRGYAFAFDLPSSDHLQAFLGQRFWRGAIVFGAGSRTVRYRLSLSFGPREIGRLFEGVRRSLSWLDAHPHQQPPRWEDDATPNADKNIGESPEYAISTVDPGDAMTLLPSMLDIEYQVYEPVRRTPPAQLRAAVMNPEGIVTIAEAREGNDWQLVGFAIGAPLEQIAPFEEGPDQDVMIDDENTLYSLSLTVMTEHQGQGLGRALKETQLREAGTRKKSDGTSRFRYVTGRNRVGHTAAMTHLNHVFGAHQVGVLTGQYADPEGQAVYYRIPLAPICPRSTQEVGTSRFIEGSLGIERPLNTAPESLCWAQDQGLLFGPTVNKITLLNYVTPNVVRSLEWVSALVPELPHMYLTSSRDELIDKSLRILRWHRPQAHLAVGLRGGYVGHTTGAARSLSDPDSHRQGDSYFAWPRLSHPSLEGTKATLDELRQLIKKVGADSVLGVVCEVVGERSGFVLPQDFAEEWQIFRRDYAVPLVLVETASACYRNTRGAFAFRDRNLQPDLLLWWGGGQTGYIHVRTPYRVAKPLAMASTWDGDELSLIREYHQLQAARRLDLADGMHAMEELVQKMRALGITSRGLGLHRVLEAGKKGATWQEELAHRGIRMRCLSQGRLVVSPPLDCAAETIGAITNAFQEIVQ